MGTIMGHLPWRLSGVCSFFLRQGGTISCTVTGGIRYSIDLYITLTLTFVYCAQQCTCYYRTINYRCLIIVYKFSWVVQRWEEMAHPVLTKGFLSLSPEVAMLPGPSVKNRPPPPVPPFLLAQNLSPKVIARSDISCWKLYDTYMHLSCIIGLAAIC